VAYATRAEVLATFDTPPTSADKLARIDALLLVAENEIDREVGHDFNATGPETRAFDGDGGRRLHLHVGVVPTPTVAFLDRFGGTSTSIAAGDLVWEAEDPATGSYDHVRILGTTSGYGAWPTGAQLIRITGTFGFATVPPDVKQATIDRVRQLYAADPSVIGGVVGSEEFGRPVIPPRYPQTMYAVVEHYRRRFASCYVGG